LVTIPLVVLLVGGGVLVTSLGVQYRQAHTARTYADAILPALTASKALDNEFALPETATNTATLSKLRATTDAQVRTLRPLLISLSKKNPNDTNLPTEAEAALDALSSMSNSRALVDRLLKPRSDGKPGPLQSASADERAVAVNQVSSSTTTLRNSVQNMIVGLTGELQVVSPDRGAIKSATFVASVNQVLQNATAERQIFDSVLAGETSMTTDRFSQLQQAIKAQDLSLSSASPVATQQQTLQLTALTNNDSRLQAWRTALQGLLSNPSAYVGEKSAFDQFSNDRLDTITKISTTAALDTRSAARSAETSSLFRVGGVTGAVLLTMLVVTGLLTTIARTVTVPLRRLRAGAVEVASVQLPAAVARIEQDGVGADISLPPVLPADAYAGPETLEVARAVDDLGAEAVRLATAQVRLRRALDEAFVSMSRRSQSMVEKQLAIIDELESQEQDPDQLRNLFRLDHLAARMRRYNDNLLVLAGSAVRTRATAPVKIAELFRAATSEMEQYERVRLQPVSGASIAGTVAGELVHLLAELLDNAAMYSPPSSAIVLSAAFTADGGLQIEVLDAGVGISPGELDRLNGRLSQPESIDTQVPSRMGLFVVARLARRGTFGVMLQSRPDASGTIALVRVPATLVIGAPGSTGEVPVIPASVAIRPSSPPTGQFAAYAPPAALTPVQAPSSPVPTGAPAPAAAAAAVAAEAAAGVRSVAGNNTAANSAALPRRRRVTATGPTAGLPPEAIAAAANPATGLFTPITPAAAPSEEAGERRPSGATALNRTPAMPPETSPTGISNLPVRNPAQPWTAPPFSSPDSPYEQTSTESPFTPRTPPLPAGDSHHFDTPAAGITGLPGLAPPVRRSPAPQPNQPAAYQDPLTTPAGLFRAEPNQGLPGPATNGNGHGNGGWDEDLPTELAARAAAAAAYRPSDPNAPMIGDDVRPDFNDPTPIFDQISVWFTAEPSTGTATVSADLDGDQVIDLREQDERRPSNRWASLGDQRWLATNARAAAAPDTAGTTETGLPKRRPGANLLPSAATAAASPAPAPVRPAPVRQVPVRQGSEASGGQDNEQNAQEAAIVRGRLGSYQRGLANARRARSQSAPAPAFDPVGASLFTVNEAGDDAGHHSGDQGGDQ
jgi:signal transduction histidine kinase